MEFRETAIGDAFDSYFKDPEWTYAQLDSPIKGEGPYGDKKVTFSGKLPKKLEYGVYIHPKKADVVVYFDIDSEGTPKIAYITVDAQLNTDNGKKIDPVPQQLYEYNWLFDEIFD